MDLKQKFRSFLTKQDLHQVPPPHLSHDLSFTPPVGVSREKIDSRPSDPHVDQDILDGIEETFYSTEEDFDPGRHELQKLGEDAKIEDINQQRLLLHSQLQVVSRKVSELILSKQSACSSELERVGVLKTELGSSLTVCKTARNYLNVASSTFTAASLGILANYRKRQQLCRLVSELGTVKTLLSADEHVGRLLSNEDYSGAITLLLECQKISANYSHYSCIEQLSNRLKDTLVLAREALDKALAKVCVDWNVDTYEHVMEAYSLLGETQAAMDQLHLHITTAILSEAGRVLASRVEHIDYNKLAYQDLCKEVSDAEYLTCLLDLCQAMWEILRNYYCILSWHNECAETDTGSNMEQALSQEYCRQKLSRGPQRVWQDIQIKLSQYLEGLKFKSIKVNDFLYLLDIMHKMMEIGEEFCGSGSEVLEKCLEEQTREFLAAYHRDQMDDLRAVLENESWEPVPVGRGFNYQRLQEFSFITSRETSTSKPESEKKSDNPFLFLRNPTSREERISVGADSDDEISDELRKGFVEEESKTIETNNGKWRGSIEDDKSSPVIVTSVLTVLRLTGRYLCMMKLLPSTAQHLFSLTTQLLDYIFYTIYHLFLQQMPQKSKHSPTIKIQLKDTLRRISDQLILQQDQTEQLYPEKYHLPVASPLIDSSKALLRQLVAGETLAFLCSQLHLLHPRLNQLLPNQTWASLDSYFTQTIDHITELKEPMYANVVSSMINYEHVVTEISQVTWDIKDVKDYHNQYVDVLLRELQVFSMHLDEIKGELPLPPAAFHSVWKYAMYYSALAFLDGFSFGRKVSLEGRSWMLLDWKQFLLKAERFVPAGTELHASLVEEYIRGYYIAPDALSQWISNHKEYTPQQLVGLLNCIPNLNKKMRQQLISRLEES